MTRKPLLLVAAIGMVLVAGCGSPAEDTNASPAAKTSDTNRPVANDASIPRGEK